MLPRLKPDAVNITIPNLYGLGYIYFPQISGRNYSNKALCAGNDVIGMFHEEDALIENFLNENNKIDEKKINELILYMSGNCYSEEEICSNFNMTIKKIRKREENWDIKITDFILDHYKEVKLFYEPFHPTNILIEELVKKILLKLNIVSNYITIEMNMGEHEVPILPCVKKCLNLQWDDQFIRNGVKCKSATDNMDLSEYVKQYIWWRINNL